jgi:hypothetical protein
MSHLVPLSTEDEAQAEELYPLVMKSGVTPVAAA